MRRTALVVAASLVLVGSCLVMAGIAFGSEEFDKYGLESISASLSNSQAGAHADLTVAFDLTENQAEARPYALTKNVDVALPPGMIGNPQSFPRCTLSQLGQEPGTSECPQDSQLGVSEIKLAGEVNASLTEPIYNMPSPGGDVVARFGFFAGPYPSLIDVRVNPEDYSLTASIEGAPAAAELISAVTTLWGVQAAEAQDDQRLTPGESISRETPPIRHSGQPKVPFLTNPTDCSTARRLEVTAASYQLPGQPSSMSAAFPQISGCGKLGFGLSFTATPTNSEAAAPTGLDAVLEIPQEEAANTLAPSTLKSATVTLPVGMTINSAAGDGLAACSAAQVGYGTSNPSACPEAAKIGNVALEVPALEHTLNGAVYQRTPEPGELFRFWLVTDEQGVHLKLPAKIEPDPATGKLTTVFAGIPVLGGNPQVPFSKLSFHIFGGPRAPLATPSTCGSYQTHYEFVPWSGNPAVTGDTPMRISSGCGKAGFSPSLTAGTVSPFAGHFSTFVMQLTRNDGEANPSALEVTLPKGLLAKLRGVPLCGDAEAASGACPAGSKVGSVEVATGVGGVPLWIPQPGKSPTAVYLAGRYGDAPYSLVITVPAQAGPFDLGTVVTRARIEINPETTVATVISDPLPQILQGVPITYRAIRVDIDRSEFALNPTDCDAMAIEAHVLASDGEQARPVAAYQASNCATLGFKPKLTLSLKGSTRRAGHPALKAVLTYPKQGAYANIARAQVNLPRSEFIDQGNLDKTCTRPVLLAGNCSARSIYGKVKAWTPLLEKPLEGPVYLVGGYGYKLPALVAELNGQIRVLLVGKVDSGPNKGIRNTFETVPDAPVEKFVLEMKGGPKYSLLENSEPLCRKPQRAIVQFTAQNGRAMRAKPLIVNDCGKGHGGKKPLPKKKPGGTRGKK
jgi:hypothetical protein